MALRAPLILSLLFLLFLLLCGLVYNGVSRRGSLNLLLLLLYRSISPVNACFLLLCNSVNPFCRRRPRICIAAIESGTSILVNTTLVALSKELNKYTLIRCYTTDLLFYERRYCNFSCILFEREIYASKILQTEVCTCNTTENISLV